MKKSKTSSVKKTTKKPEDGQDLGPHLRPQSSLRATGASGSLGSALRAAERGGIQRRFLVKCLSSFSGVFLSLRFFSLRLYSSGIDGTVEERHRRIGIRLRERSELRRGGRFSICSLSTNSDFFLFTSPA